MKQPQISLDDVRRHAIRAFAADDELGELLVFKGGNALRLVHRIGNRASLDLDYSTEFDLGDTAATRMRIALAREFASIGYTVFDVRMTQKPPGIPPEEDERPTWGGWVVEFKLIDSRRFAELGGNPERLRNYSLELYEQKKSFHIDISKHEYVDAAQTIDFDGYPLRVYSPAMILFEKLRALCQQMKAYPYVSHPAPRARDFVDICAILDGHSEEVLRESGILGAVFAAKDVPLRWLGALSHERTFHMQGWPAVAAQIEGGRNFDEYFDRVITFVERLQALGIVESPST